MKKYIGDYAIELCTIDGYRRKRKRKRKKKESSQDRYKQMTGM